MVEELREKLRVLEHGLSNFYVMSLSQLEAKSWLCSKELQPGWFTRTYLHTPRVLLQLPCATQQEDFCATYGMGSYSFQLQSWIIHCYLGDLSQWVSVCPSLVYLSGEPSPDSGTFLAEAARNLLPCSKED